MKTQKEIEERKKDLRRKHQKEALDAASFALRKIKDHTERYITAAKQNGWSHANIATDCLETAKEGLKEIERCQLNFKKELREDRPAEHLGRFLGVEDDG